MIQPVHPQRDSITQSVRKCVDARNRHRHDLSTPYSFWWYNKRDWYPCPCYLRPICMHCPLISESIVQLQIDIYRGMAPENNRSRKDLFWKIFGMTDRFLWHIQSMHICLIAWKGFDQDHTGFVSGLFLLVGRHKLKRQEPVICSLKVLSHTLLTKVEDWD